MSFSNWILFFFILQIIHFLGTWKLYIKANKPAWASIIPIYNAFVLMKIINRPKWWVILLFLPIINLILLPIIWVETLRSFGFNSRKDTLLVIFSLGLYIYWINYSSDNISYIEKRSLKPLNPVEDWISSILFAVIAATTVHNYFIQPYIIPTGSLEKTLLVGDFLFVSKFHYGARNPMTAVSFPMVHDTIPLLKKRSYLKNPQAPYFRLPGFQKVKRNEIVVFNWPADTVRQFFVREKRVEKPIDKKSNYVKRCVGIPGDTLAIIDGFVHINGKQTILPNRARPQYTYSLYNAKGISSKKLLSVGVTGFNRKFIISNITQNSYKALLPYIIGVTNNEPNNFVVLTRSSGIPIKVIRKHRIKIKESLETQKRVTLTLEQEKKLTSNKILDSLIRKIDTLKRYNTSFFPNRITYNWNEDNFGPIYIPKKGSTVALNLENLPLYKKIILDYEKNTLEIQNNTIYINGKATDSYTFKQDYYWMMGDNRHQSEDSRYWGYVPENHIVGKPVFIWFSVDNFNAGIKNWKVRWDRVFTTVQGKGERVSYFPYFIVLFVLWQAYSFYRKRKKAKKSNS